MTSHVMFSTCLDGRTGRNVGRTILILMMFASPFMKSDKALRGGENDLIPLVGAACLCRQAAVSCRAQSHFGSVPGVVCGPRFCRGRDRDPAGLARQRGAPACLRDRADCTRHQPDAALPAHLAGICRQEAARRGRAAAVHLRARVPQSRTHRAASPRIHDARVVSRQRALRHAHRRLRGADVCRRGSGRVTRVSLRAAAKPIRSPRRNG